MKKQKLSPNEVVFSATMSACEKGTQWQWALHLLSDFKKAAAGSKRSRIGDSSLDMLGLACPHSGVDRNLFDVWCLELRVQWSVEVLFLDVMDVLYSARFIVEDRWWQSAARRGPENSQASVYVLFLGKTSKLALIAHLLTSSHMLERQVCCTATVPVPLRWR